MKPQVTPCAPDGAEDAILPLVRLYGRGTRIIVSRRSALEERLVETG
jgi:hypothetical protein